MAWARKLSSDGNLSRLMAVADAQDARQYDLADRIEEEASDERAFNDPDQTRTLLRISKEIRHNVAAGSRARKAAEASQAQQVADMAAQLAAVKQAAIAAPAAMVAANPTALTRRSRALKQLRAAQEQAEYERSTKRRRPMTPEEFFSPAFQRQLEVEKAVRKLAKDEMKPIRSYK